MLRAHPLALLAALLLAPPPAPAADVYGGIELGGKGVKAVVIEVTPTADGPAVKMLFSESTNVGLAAAVADGKLDPKAAEAAGKAVSGFAATMKEKHLVPADKLFVVGSSGLFAANAGKPEVMKANQETLTAAVKAAAELPVAYLDADREVALSFAGTVPAERWADGLMIDVGGGNAKGGFRGEKGAMTTFAVPFGTTTFAAAVVKEGGEFAATAAKLRQSVLAPAIKKAATDAGFATRKRIYVSGGAAWAVATFAHPADRSAYTPLTIADLDAVEALLAKATDAPAPDLSGVADPGTKKEAEAEAAKVNKVYTRDQLLAGVQVLKAVATELDLGHADKKLAFARNAQYAWVIGYVSEKVAPK